MTRRPERFATGLVLLLASAHFIHDVFTAFLAHFMINFAARAVILLAVGWLGDTVGLRTTYMWSGGFALLGLPFVFLLPKSIPRG